MDVTMRKQEFLDEDCLLPIGTVTIFAGRGGVGKTTFALDYVAKVSRGTLPGKYFNTPRRVLVISHEDDPGTQLKPRLVAAGVDERQVELINVRSHYSGGSVDHMPLLNRDWQLLQEAIDNIKPALIIIDPLTSAMEGDLHKVHDVRRALTPLTKLAQDNELAIIAISHFNKGAGSVSDKVTGSHAFRDVARSVLLFAKDPDTDTVVVTVDKSNYSRKAGYSFRFELEDTKVEIRRTEWDVEVAHVARIKMLGESDISVADLTRREWSDPEDMSETEHWLHEYLTGVGGTAMSNEVKRAAKASGFSERTLQRASKKLCQKRQFGFPPLTEWTLRDFVVKPESAAANAANAANAATPLGPGAPGANGGIGSSATDSLSDE